jgi:hypothetical protein
MIMGITQNCTKEAIPLVQWQSEVVPTGIHHGNLSPYEESYEEENINESKK